MDQKANESPAGPGTSGRTPPARDAVSKGRRTNASIGESADELLENEDFDLTRLLIDAAKRGDIRALEACQKRLLSHRAGQWIQLELPASDTPRGVLGAVDVTLAAAGRGEISLEHADALVRLLETKRKALETVDLALRVERLEAKMVEAQGNSAEVRR